MTRHEEQRDAAGAVGRGPGALSLTADGVETVTMPFVTAASGPDRVVPEEPEAGELWASLR